MIVDGIDGEIVPIRTIGMEANFLTEQTSFSNLARMAWDHSTCRYPWKTAVSHVLGWKCRLIELTP